MDRNGRELHVVRGFGYNIMHSVAVLPSQVLAATTVGGDFSAISLPLKSLCDTTLRSYQSTMIVMDEGNDLARLFAHRHMCKHCRRDHERLLG